MLQLRGSEAQAHEEGRTCQCQWPNAYCEYVHMSSRASRHCGIHVHMRSVVARGSAPTRLGNHAFRSVTLTHRRRRGCHTTRRSSCAFQGPPVATQRRARPHGSRKHHALQRSHTYHTRCASVTHPVTNVDVASSSECHPLPVQRPRDAAVARRVPARSALRMTPKLCLGWACGAQGLPLGRGATCRWNREDPNSRLT